MSGSTTIFEEICRCASHGPGASNEALRRGFLEVISPVAWYCYLAVVVWRAPHGTTIRPPVVVPASTVSSLSHASLAAAMLRRVDSSAELLRCVVQTVEDKLGHLCTSMKFCPQCLVKFLRLAIYEKPLRRAGSPPPPGERVEPGIRWASDAAGDLGDWLSCGKLGACFQRLADATREMRAGDGQLPASKEALGKVFLTGSAVGGLGLMFAPSALGATVLGGATALGATASIVLHVGATAPAPLAPIIEPLVPEISLVSIMEPPAANDEPPPPLVPADKPVSSKGGPGEVAKGSSAQVQPQPARDFETSGANNGRGREAERGGSVRESSSRSGGPHGRDAVEASGAGRREPARSSEQRAVRTVQIRSPLWPSVQSRMGRKASCPAGEFTILKSSNQIRGPFPLDDAEANRVGAAVLSMALQSEACRD